MKAAPVVGPLEALAGNSVEGARDAGRPWAARRRPICRR
jgi:hypothetical protein